MYMAHSPCFLSPLADSLLLPLLPLFPFLLTWNPPSCDRIRPPRSQVACKLTSPAPTLPFQIPGTPITPRLTKTTSRWIRRLSSGTCTIPIICIVSAEKVKLLKPDSIYKGNYFPRFPWSLLPLFGLAVLIQVLGTAGFGLGFRLHRCPHITVEQAVHTDIWDKQHTCACNWSH